MMRCLGTVLAAIACLAVGFALLLAVLFGLITLAEASSDYFGFTSFGLARPLFLFGYTVIGLGTIFGVAACRAERAS
jgi:hypothetical protein